MIEMSRETLRNTLRLFQLEVSQCFRAGQWPTLLAQMRGYAPHEERARASVPLKALISVLDGLHHRLLLFSESLLCI